uniref:RNA polymerase I subunit E n=1 Tax=Canis lupus familiaris TaxID=9615 RepID=A0A8P0TIW3_CANLF
MAAEVLPSARWLYCGQPDESQRAVLVQFSNGKLQNPGNVRFTLYKSNDSTNPRKRSQRILAAETDRLSYVGNNFGTGALKCNTLCRHFVGILNKTSGQMQVYDAELFNMQPLFAALVNDAIHDDLQDDSLYLPPCHADAAKPEDVYKFEDLLSTAEYEALQSPSEAFRNVSSEEILKMIEENSHCSFVIEALKSLPSDEKSRDRQARCIWFLDTLIKFRAQKVVKRKSALGPGIPHVINTKLLKHFTCLTYNNGRSGIDFGVSAYKGESRRGQVARVGREHELASMSTDTADGGTHCRLQEPGVKSTEEALYITCSVPPGEVHSRGFREFLQRRLISRNLPNIP